MRIHVKFKGHPCLFITVHDTETGRLYFDLTRKQNQIQTPYYRDSLLWTNEYMIELAKQAKDAFGWDWLHDRYDLSVTAKLHKDLENSVGKLGFENVPEKYDSLLYDLHHCLHAIQYGKTRPGRPDNLQIEWFTDEFISLPESFTFKESSEYGDLLLINPYVGHNPLQIYRENDFTCLSTTCKFHNIIKPGIVLSSGFKITKDIILEKFKEKNPEFVKLHGEDKIRYYSGLAVIGHTDNPQVLQQIKNCPSQLSLDKVEFYE